MKNINDLIIESIGKEFFRRISKRISQNAFI